MAWQYGDGTIDGTGTKRLDYDQLLPLLSKKIKKANEELKVNLKGRTYAEECFIPADKKPAIEAALQKLKDAHKSGDTAAIDAAINELNAAWQAASAQMYQGAQGQPGADPNAGFNGGAGGAGFNGGAQQGPQSDNNQKPDAEDADFEEVK